MKWDIAWIRFLKGGIIEGWGPIFIRGYQGGSSIKPMQWSQFSCKGEFFTIKSSFYVSFVDFERCWILIIIIFKKFAIYHEFLFKTNFELLKFLLYAVSLDLFKWLQLGQCWSYNLQNLHGNRSKWGDNAYFQSAYFQKTNLKCRVRNIFKMAISGKWLIWKRK